MPSHGQHSFLLRPFSSTRREQNVSMPSHGQHSFLLYPLKCPCFMRIIDPIFAGTSQNILKKAFFRGFTCMFTVCSYLSIRLVFTMPSASKSIISYFSQTSYKNLALFLRNPEIFQDHISTCPSPGSSLLFVLSRLSLPFSLYIFWTQFQSYVKLPRHPFHSDSSAATQAKLIPSYDALAPYTLR